MTLIMMAEKSNHSMVGNQNSTKLQNNVSQSLSTIPCLPLYQRSLSNNKQNYFQFRCAEYQRVNSFSPSPYSFTNKQTNHLTPNSRPSLMQNLTNTDSEVNPQEYCRYRGAASLTPIKTPTAQIQHFTFPCYVQLTNQNENEYSRYRDSRSSRKKSTSGIGNTFFKLHYKCRSLTYDCKSQRFPVPDNKVFWNIIFPDYAPIEYTTEKIKSNPKADPIDPWKIDTFNQIDKKIDRRSFTGPYYTDPITNRPQNPIGRTGLTGRGRLYYWGPNHAGDPVVTRWCRDQNGSIIQRRLNAVDRLKPVLEFVAIQRRDTKQWALPGGMVDANESVYETIKREFQEEAMRDGLDKNLTDELFANGYTLFESYVDDPRNTDNAWLETVAVQFHDETGQITKHLHLSAGDDAEKVVWCPVDRKLELYACHKDILKIVVDRLDAYW